MEFSFKNCYTCEKDLLGQISLLIFPVMNLLIVFCDCINRCSNKPPPQQAYALCPYVSMHHDWQVILTSSSSKSNTYYCIPTFKNSHGRLGTTLTNPYHSPPPKLRKLHYHPPRKTPFLLRPIQQEETPSIGETGIYLEYLYQVQTVK